MKRFMILVWLLFVLAIPSQVFGAAAMIHAGGLIGGSSDDLDAVECEDIVGDDTDRAIVTGDRAMVVTTSGTYIYRYDATGTDSESSPDIIVPDDRATDCGGNGQWNLQALVVDWDNLIGITGEKGAIPYWDTASTLSRFRCNQSDIEGYIPQVTGTYPNSVLSYTNTLDVTKIIFPNAADPTTDTEGQCSWDTNNRALECYDDSSQILATIEKCEDITFPTPNDMQSESDDWPIKHFAAESFPHGAKITAIKVLASASASDILTFELFNASYTDTTTDIEAITLSAATQAEDDGIDNATITADYYVVCDLDASTDDISFYHITICYEIEDGN